MKIILFAIRSLMRFRLYTIINILGLALSLACVIIISRYVYSEATTDHFCTDHERIYLSVRHWENGERMPRLVTTDNVLVKRDYIDPLDIPEIEKRSSFVSLADVTIKVNERRFNAHVLATDSVFLQILDYPVLEGNRNLLLTDPKEAVITQKFARKLFGTESPVGKTLDYNGNIITIRGIIGEAATQSSLAFDLLISKKLQWRWPPVNFYTVAFAVSGTDMIKINKKLRAAYEAPDNNNFLYQVIPLDKLYMDKTVEKGQNSFRQGNPDGQQILSLVALLLMLVGVFNFIHINSVILIKRRRELGMKKVFGAHPGQLFVQLYIENLVLTAIALFIGWFLIEVTQGLQVNELNITAIVSNTFSGLLSFLLLVVLPFVITLHPFFSYSFRHTITSLRGIAPAKGRISGHSFFLVIQYCITCCLIISSLFFMKQLNFMLHADLGYRTKDVIKAWFHRPSSAMSYSNEEIQREADIAKQVKEVIKSSPLFEASCYGFSPYEWGDNPFNKEDMRTPGGEWQEIIFVRIPDNYFDFYQIPVTVNSSSAADKGIWLNESARKLFFSQKEVSVQLERKAHIPPEAFSIKGFTPDFQIAHLSQNNVSIVMTVDNPDIFNPGKLMAKIAPGRRQEAVQYLKSLHEKMVGGEFEYSFVEDEISAMYEKDRLITKIYSIFAIISILISSLGLFGLSLFDIQQRYKEIAIRKVNGATTTIITSMLLRKYFPLLGIAFLIATPISWLAITKYLENFANKASLSWWIFVVAFLITAGISLLTLIWQIHKAAGTNPAQAIKTE